eukprot:gene12779-12908_t
MLPGLFDVLPDELIDAILDSCCAKQLALLRTTCSYFSQVKAVESLAEIRLRSIPRAKGIIPNPAVHEQYTSILHFIISQSAAAAQATAVNFGANHTAALLLPTTEKVPETHHSLYTFGRGWHGQLGHGNFDNQAKPTLLCIGYQPSMDQPTMEEEITAAVIACGSDFTSTITRRGQLLTWGLGSRGELGHELPASGEVTVPMRASLALRPNTRIVSVACGAFHTLAIAETGTVWSCGRNQDGQLGNGGFNDAVHLLVPNQVIVLATPQKITCLEPANLKPYRRVTSIASGAHHACAVTVSGAMLMFGRNNHGQLGTGDRLDRWAPVEVNMAKFGESSDLYRTVQVSCGMQHTLALVAHQGRIKTFSTGANVYGQLGLGSQDPTTRFTSIPRTVSLEVVAVQAGDYTSAAITQDGHIWLWGRNTHCQLGTGDDISRWTPIKLKGFKAVHPDKTLRKSRRTAPRMRKVNVPATPAASKSTNALIFWHPVPLVRQQCTPVPLSTADPNARVDRA